MNNSNHFPPIKRAMIESKGEDRNPAIQLFGRRFFSDQSIPEILLEFLSLLSSPKLIQNIEIKKENPFPDLSLIKNWPGMEPLKYSPNYRLTLKLFSFLSASKLESRHETHRKHYQHILDYLTSPDKLKIFGPSKKEEIANALENLFLGFQSVGGQRTWCTQSFLPVSPEMIAGESIWQQTKAKKKEPHSWDDALQFFSHNQHIFLARSGELLYLQLCNVFRQKKEDIIEWNQKANYVLSEDECDPQYLYEKLTNSLASVFEDSPQAIGQIADYIDSALKSEKESAIDQKYYSCGWCPNDSWQETLFFIIELINICEAAIDPIERIKILEIACAMQILRSLCAQSSRILTNYKPQNNIPDIIKYVWSISDPEGINEASKQISRRCVNTIKKLIYDSIRHPEIQKIVDKQEGMEDKEKVYKKADNQYGYKLFISIAKRIGLIVPRRGAGERFILNDKIIRFLVMALIPPGERRTYETFKDLTFNHFGLALDNRKISQTCTWCGSEKLSTLGSDTDEWLSNMLSSGGLLIKLSDSCSLVKNPFGSRETK